MSGDFSIEIDRPRRLLRVRMSGFYSPEDVARYYAAIDIATQELGGAPGTQRMINDISEMRIQAQDVVAAFREGMADARYAERKVGFVVASSLARMQLQRVIGNRHAELFATEGEAEAWLFGEDDGMSGRAA